MQLLGLVQWLSLRQLYATGAFTVKAHAHHSTNLLLLVAGLKQQKHLTPACKAAHICNAVLTRCTASAVALLQQCLQNQCMTSIMLVADM
jgi:hypothetical protein